MPITTRGLFITFEGTEGSGKSTQMRLLVDRLQRDGYTVAANQEPGGTAIGKDIRRILLDPVNAEMAAATELLLMFASRAQAAAETIVPALARGEIVVSDRFTDSSLAYQGGGRKLGFDKVMSLHKLALDSLLPDITLCLSVDLEAGLARAASRNRETNTGVKETRIDEQSFNFHRRVAEAYGQIAQAEPDRFLLIDGNESVESVAERVWDTVQLRVDRLKA